MKMFFNFIDAIVKAPFSAISILKIIKQIRSSMLLKNTPKGEPVICTETLFFFPILMIKH